MVNSLSASSSDGPDQQKFCSLLAQAREVASAAGDQGAEVFYESAALWASDRRLHPQRVAALQELVEYYLTHHRYKSALATADKLRQFQIETFGKEHPGLAKTESLIGICNRQMRWVSLAIESLRSAVVRYQASDDVNASEFGITLLELSRAYREANKRTQARTCVKQAIAIVSGASPPDPLLHVQLLDEFGSLLYDNNEIAASVPIFRKAVELKQSIFGRKDPSLIGSLTGLGMSLFSLHQFELAESAFMEAAYLAQCMPQRDPVLITNLLDKLVGTLRVQSRLAEAAMLQDGANEWVGGQSHVSLYETYRKEMEVGFAAQRLKDNDTATGAFRNALRILEHLRHRNVADLISIQIRMQLLAEQRNQKLQAQTIAIEIEEELAELFGNRQITMVEACLEMARLFVVQGKFIAAEAFFLYAERLCRSEHNYHLYAQIAGEHSQILDHLKQQEDSVRMLKIARRLGFDTAQVSSGVPVLGGRAHMQPVPGERKPLELIDSQALTE